MVAGQANVWAVVAQARPALPAEEQKKWIFLWVVVGGSWKEVGEEEDGEEGGEGRVERSIMLPMPLFGVLVSLLRVCGRLIGRGTKRGRTET